MNSKTLGVKQIAARSGDHPVEPPKDVFCQSCFLRFLVWLRWPWQPLIATGVT